ncbi:hypothetical protein HGRIS_005646 [Hohenbuehelia grisea]|uniref:Fcf2 pre-rRNA processing C-terminal domain-containing protein n=1 Tax=Hohenbuehelia grisea TaxID=104357 RepID=A0ABR3JYI2_9AGAR
MPSQASNVLLSAPSRLDKGKGKAIEITQDEEASDSSSSTSEYSDSSDSGSDSDVESSSTPSRTTSSKAAATAEYLNSLLEKARRNALEAESSSAAQTIEVEEDLIVLEKTEGDQPLPSLDPGPLPAPYLEFSESRRQKKPLAIHDPDVQRAQKAAALLSAPAPPIPPPELAGSGRPLTKKERKAAKLQTAGPDWFDLPAPAEADLPRLYREVEALRLRNQLDPKRFYRKDEGEGKGIKGLPKYFAIGTILPSKTPFGTPSGDNLTRSQRKRTLVEELVDDAEARRYAKKKFEDLQQVRGAKGRNTLFAKRAARQPKW